MRRGAGLTSALSPGKHPRNISPEGGTLTVMCLMPHVQMCKSVYSLKITDPTMGISTLDLSRKT